MSKKETRRAARQAFPGGPPTARKNYAIRGEKPRQVSRKKPTYGPRGQRQTLRKPTLKRAAIQGAVLAVLYFILIRFIWKEENTGPLTYVILPLAGFLIYTAVAYAVDKFTYQRKLRKLGGSSK